MSVSLFFGVIEDIFGNHFIVVYGVCVGHTGYVGKAAVNRRAHARSYRFLTLETGLSQMRVHIEKAVKEVFARPVDDRIGATVHPAYFSDNAVLYKDVRFLKIVAHKRRVFDENG